jgi:hypothetical protein
MENMKCVETDPLAERKMNEILHRLQGNEENNSSIGICICLTIIFAGSLKTVIEDFYNFFKRNRLLMCHVSCG